MTPFDLADIKTVYERISPFIRRTPVLNSIFHSQKYGVAVNLKLENLNITGSFKIRGASNAILSASADLTKNGIIAASAGNHAQGVAYSCMLQKLKSTVFMPVGTPFVKTQRTRSHGAEIILEGESYDEAYQAALEYKEKNHMFMVHPFADLNVIKGQATIALELLEQMPNLGAIVVPIGGGGMIAGIAGLIKSVRPDIKIFGVQTEAYPAMMKSFYSRKIVATERQATIAEGIAVKNVNQLNFDMIRTFVDKIVCVTENEIAQTIMELMEQNRIVAEGAAATSVAALSYLEDEIAEITSQGREIVCIISGGNIDVTLLSKIVNRGLIHSGRLMQLSVSVRDRPGALAALLAELAKQKANILQIHHQRVFGNRHFNDVEVDLELEVMDHAHQDDVERNLIKAGYSVAIK